MLESIRNFKVDTQLKTEKIDDYPVYVNLLKNCLTFPEKRLSAKELIDLLNVNIYFKKFWL